MFSNFFFSKIKKHNFVFNNFFLNRAVLEIMWKNTVEQDRPQMTIWRMRIAYSTPKATNTHPQYVIRAYCFTTTTMVARTCLNITLYVHCLSCLKLSALCIQIFTSNKTIWGEEPRQVVTQGGGVPLYSVAMKASYYALPPSKCYSSSPSCKWLISQTFHYQNSCSLLVT